MSIPAEVRGKFYALRAAALAVGILGVAGVILGTHNLGVRSLGLVGIVVCFWLMRRSKAYVWRARGQEVAEWSLAGAARRVGPRAWTVMGVSLAACGVFYLAIYLDAVHGGREVWPVYALLGACVVFIVTAGYAAMRMFL